MASARKRKPYPVYAVDQETGRRERLDVDGLTVELRPGVEVEIALLPHPNFAGQLVMLCPPTARMKQRYDAGSVDSFAVFFGGENVLHVSVETRTRGRRRRGAASKSSSSTAKSR